MDSPITLNGATECTPEHLVQVLNFEAKRKLGAYHVLQGIKDAYRWHLEAAGSAPDWVPDQGGKAGRGRHPGHHLYAANSKPPWRLLAATSTPDKGNTIDGNARPYRAEKKQQQTVEGHASNFGGAPANDSAAPSGAFALLEREPGTVQATLRIVDLPPPGPQIHAEIATPPEAPCDFTAAAHAGPKHGVAHMASKAGYLLIFTIATAPVLARTRVSQKSVSAPVGSEQSDGAILAKRKGRALSGKVNETPFINDFSSSDCMGEATVAAQHGSGLLRTPRTIKQFRSIQAPKGQPSPTLRYFITLFEHGKPKALEPLEQAHPHFGGEGGCDEAAAKPAREHAFNQGQLQAGDTCGGPPAPTEPGGIPG
ncbi:unnamed protein product, partial [Prorocentrum cordatum]